MRKICIVTGSRADYGLLKCLIDFINNDNTLELVLLVTGSHLSQEFGLTINEIVNDGYAVSDQVDILLSSDSPEAISKSIGLGLIGFADRLNYFRPDLILLLGDRYEIFSAAVTALILCIPIAHIHGGEVTEGAIDEALRHSISKMSHFHFVATEEYKKRVIQLGENPQRVFNVGGLGIDNIKKIKMLNKEQLENNLQIKFGKRNLLVTFHPVTLELESIERQICELLNALSFFDDITFIFTMPNADTNGRIIMNLIEKFCIRKKNSYHFKSLGQKNYFSLINYCNGVIGNSSSGLLEVPTFKKGTINIGNRQKGRIKASSVIDCKATKNEIIESINLLYSKKFQSQLKSVINPYGEGGASKSILEIIKKIELKDVIKKKFYDLP